MLSFRLGRWTPYVQNTVRAQSDLFTVQCCHWASKAEGTPSTLSEHRSDLFTVQCCHWDSQADGPLMCKTLSEHRVISSLFNVVIETQRQMEAPPVQNTVRAQSDLSNCSMLSLRLKGRWTTPYVQNTARAQSDLFTVQCCHSDSKADGHPQSTLSENRVISSLFNVVIQTQRKMDSPSQHCESTEWSLHCSMLSLRLKGRWTPSVQNTARAQSDLFTVQCCHSDSKVDGAPPGQHYQRTELSLHCSMLSFRLKGRWSSPSQHCQSTEWSLNCSMLSFRLKGRWTPPGQHCESTEWSLHCSMLSFRLKGRWTPPCAKHYQRTELSLHCSMLSFRLKCRWTPPSTLSEHRVISSLFNVVIEAQKQRDSPQSTLSEHRVISSLFNVVIDTQRQMDPPMCKTLSQHRVISSLFNVVIETQRQTGHPPVNTVRPQSDHYTVQCCHWDSKTDGPPSQYCQSTEWSLHSSMLSFRLKGRWTPPGQHCQSTQWSHHCSMLSFRLTRQMDPSVQTTVRAQSDLFTLQCCHSDSKAGGPPWSTLSEHRVISSLFNVVIQTQRQMDPPCAKHCQSTEWSLHCSMLSFRFKGKWTTPQSTLSEHRVDLFTVQCCHSDSKADATPPKTLSEHRVISSLFNVVIQTQRQMDPLPGAKHCQSTELSLHCSMLSFRLKGRGTPCVQNTVRTQIDLSNVQCCHSDSKADGPPPVNTVTAQSDLLHCSMLSFRLKGRWTPSQHCQSTEWSLSLFNVVIQTHRQVDSPQNTIRAQSDLFTVQCCHSDSKADGHPMCKTLSEHRLISSMFNVVIQTQRQMDHPPVNTVRTQSYLFTVQCCHSDSKADGLPSVNTVRAQSDLFTVQCCHSDSKADGPPMCKTLPEHRVISSLFNVVIETQRQMDTPVNTLRPQSYLFTVQCCHLDSKADGPLPSTLSEHRVISSLFNVVIQTQRQVDPPMCKTLSEYRVISSLFNVIIEPQRQKDTPVNTVWAQSDLFTVQCSHWDWKTDGPPFNTVRA